MKYGPYLTISELYKSTLKIQVYLEASYVSNKDKYSQLVCMIFLTDDRKRYQMIYWTFEKSKGVTRSVLRIKVMVFSGVIDMALTTKVDLKVTYNRLIPISVMSDNLSFLTFLLA